MAQIIYARPLDINGLQAGVLVYRVGDVYSFKRRTSGSIPGNVHEGRSFATKQEAVDAADAYADAHNIKDVYAPNA